MAVTEVNALTATEGQERKVVPSRNARRPHPEVPQSNSSKWRSAEDEERKVVPSAGLRRFCMVSGNYMEAAKILRMQGGPYHPPFWHCHWVAFFRHVVTLFDKNLYMHCVADRTKMQGGPYHPPLWRCHWGYILF